MASTIPHVKPVVGNWYQDVQEGLYFEVVAVDQASGDIEVQYVDGEVSEMDRDSWNLLYLSPAAPPEDASAAYGLGADDNYYDDLSAGPDRWNNPLDEIEPDLFLGSEDF